MRQQGFLGPHSTGPVSHGAKLCVKGDGIAG